MKPDIVYEDEYMIAVIKPYGIPSQADQSNEEDMLSIVKNYLFDTSDSDEEPYLAVINRLDRPVSGIILFAKDEKTAAALSDMIQDRQIDKYYQAVVMGEPSEPEGVFSDYLVADKKTNMSKIVPKDTKGAKKAELSYEVLDGLDTDIGPLTYLLIQLHTGRHHQIRCQLAYHGMPIYGDKKYGKAPKNGKGPKGGNNKGKSSKNKQDNIREIGLYSTRIEFTHPITGEEIVLHREPEGQAFDEIDDEEF